MADKIDIIVTKEALAELERAVVQVEKLSKSISLVSTPSGLKDYNTELQKQADAIDKSTKAFEKQRLEEIRLQQNREKAFDKFEKDLNKQNTELQKQAAITAKLAEPYNKLKTAYNEAGRSLQNLIASEKASSSEIKKAQKEFDVLAEKVKKADQAVGKLSQANNGISKLTGTITNLVGAFGISTGLSLFANITKYIFETTKQIQSLDLALKMVSGTQEAFASNQSFLTNLAEQYGIGIQGLTKNFTEFWVASKGKLEAEQIKEVFTSISKSAGIMGLSVQQQDKAFLALQQMMSKGFVQAEELKGQLGDALPGAIKAATMAYQKLHPEMKVTEQLLMSEMKAGNLIASEMIPELAKAYEELYGIKNVQRAETLAASQSRLSNSWVELVRSMNESPTGGISLFFSAIIDGATGAINAITRLNTTQSDLFKEAKERGNIKGSDIALKSFQEGKLAGDEIGAADSEINEARRKEKIMRKALEKNAQLIKEIESSSVQSFLLQDNLAELKKRRELLLEEHATQSGIIKKSKELKLGIGLEESSAPINETEKQRASREKREKQSAKEAEQRSKAAFDAEMSRLKRIHEAKQDFLEDDRNFNKDEITEFKKGTELKAKLSMKLALNEIDQATKARDEKVRIAKKEATNAEHLDNLLVVIENDFYIAKENALQDSDKRIIGYTKDFFNEMDKIPKEIDLKLTSPFLQKTPEQIKEAKEENKKRAEKEKRLRKEAADVFNKFGGDFAKTVGFEDSFDFLGKLDEDGKNQFSKMFDGLEEEGERAKAVFLGIASVAQDSFNAIQKASDKKFEVEKDNIKNRKDIALEALGAEHDKNLEFAGSNAAERKIINQEYENHKRRIEEEAARKLKELQKKQAKEKKAQAIFNIAIDTAQAVMATLGKTGFFGIPMSVIVGAMGVAQIAVVAAQKIPEFAKGGTHKGGLMKVNDGAGSGFQETIVTPDGKMFQPTERNVIMDAPAGTEIFTKNQWENELNKMLSDNNISMNANFGGRSGLTYEEMDEIVGKHLGNQPKHVNNFDKAGFESYISRSGNITKNNSDRGQGIGQIV